MNESHLYNLELIMTAFPDIFQENPRMVKAMAEICLRFRHGNLQQARESMSNYIAWREKTFGNLFEHCITDSPKLLAQLKTNFLRLSPHRLQNGAAILYMSMKNHDPSLYTTNDTIKCMHFFIIASMMVDPDLAEGGFVFCNDMEGVEYCNLDMHFPGAIASAVGKAIPIRLLKIVILNAPSVVRFIIPIIKSILSTKLLERLHVVDDEDLPSLLNISKGDLPIEMGGMVSFDLEYDIQQLVNEKWCV